MEKYFKETMLKTTAHGTFLRNSNILLCPIIVLPIIWYDQGRKKCSEEKNECQRSIGDAIVVKRGEEHLSCQGAQDPEYLRQRDSV